jgi:hypothetical protein
MPSHPKRSGPRPSRRRSKCSVCRRQPVEARGLCRDCYREWRNGAPYDAPLIRTPKGVYMHCMYGTCDGRHYAKTLCRRHYLRQLAGRPMDGGKARGEAHGKAKLTEAEVRQIRKLHSQGSSTLRLSQKFGVSDDAVRDILRGRTWKHVR